MSVRIDISGLRPERIAVVPSPLAELGMALHALAEPGHHPGLQGWVTGVTAGLDPHLADRMCEADFLWRTTFSDLFLPCAGVPGGPSLPGATLAEDLDLLDKLTDEQFVDAALEFTCALAYGTEGPHALSDPEVQRRAVDLAASRGPQQTRFTERLLVDPPGVRAWLRQFLEDCDEAFFAETWSRLRHPLAAEARHKTDLLRHKGLAEALGSVSSALSLDEAARIITVDKLTEGSTVTAAWRSAPRPHQPRPPAPDGAPPVPMAAGAALPRQLPRARHPALRGTAHPADERPVPPGPDAHLPPSGAQRVHHR